ncbi:MAG: hypothetical protein JW845_02510 [Dehalococcoidales bacterium]|nr:hypothetical protein [Dehalococcoidales bacterium]
MRDKTKDKEKSPARSTKLDCGHYWIIEVANGPRSVGKCKYCGETREFFNAFPTYNPLRKNSNPLTLPKLPDVKIDEEGKS